MFMQMLKVIDAGSFESCLIYNASDECPCLEETAKNITDLPFCVKTSAVKKKTTFNQINQKVSKD